MSATGATAPTRKITGTDTNSFGILEYIAVDGAGDVYVANYYPPNDPNLPSAGVNPGTYPASKRMQAMGRSGARPLMARPLDSSDVTYEPTEIIEFAAGATSNATPLKRIGGAATKIVEPDGLALDAASNLYYADANGDYFLNAPLLPSVLLEVFPPSATGNVPPAAWITSTSYTYPYISGPQFLGHFTTGVAVY